MNPVPVIPFRWNVTNPIELGGLAYGEKAEAYPQFTQDLMKCCARVLALAGNSDLFFVGRSPESLFDYLSGILHETTRFDRLSLLHFSCGNLEGKEIRRDYYDALLALRSYLDHMGLAPEKLASGKRPVAFIDLVCSGKTMGSLIQLFYDWCMEIRFDWRSVQRRIRIVGITQQEEPSPHTWRWQQHVEWLSLLKANSIKNVSVPWRLWDYLGNNQPKVTLSYWPQQWGKPEMSSPVREPENLKALRLAASLFEAGKTKDERLRFAEELAKETAMKYSWFRKLILDLRR